MYEENALRQKTPTKDATTARIPQAYLLLVGSALLLSMPSPGPENTVGVFSFLVASSLFLKFKSRFPASRPAVNAVRDVSLHIQERWFR